MLKHAFSLFYEPNDYIDASWRTAFQVNDGWPTRLKNTWLLKQLYLPPIDSAEEWLKTSHQLPLKGWYETKAIVYLAGAYCLRAPIIAQGLSVRLAYQAHQFLYMPIGNLLPKVYFPFLTYTPQLNWPNQINDELIFQTGLCYFFQAATDIKKMGIHWFQRFILLFPFSIFNPFFQALAKSNMANESSYLSAFQRLKTMHSSSNSCKFNLNNWQTNYMQALYKEMKHWVNQYSKPFNDKLLLMCAKTYAQTISHSK